MNVLKHFIGFQHSLAFKCFFREAPACRLRVATLTLIKIAHIPEAFPTGNIMSSCCYKTDLIYYIDIKIIILKGNKLYENTENLLMFQCGLPY